MNSEDEKQLAAELDRVANMSEREIAQAFIDARAKFDESELAMREQFTSMLEQINSLWGNWGVAESELQESERARKEAEQRADDAELITPWRERAERAEVALAEERAKSVHFAERQQVARQRVVNAERERDEEQAKREAASECVDAYRGRHAEDMRRIEAAEARVRELESVLRHYAFCPEVPDGTPLERVPEFMSKRVRELESQLDEVKERLDRLHEPPPEGFT